MPNELAKRTAEAERANGLLTSARSLLHYLLMEARDHTQGASESLGKIGMELERYFDRWPIEWANPADETGPGFLTVGASDDRPSQVIINLDQDRTGHLVFSVTQARDFAQLVMNKADEAERINQS